MKRITTIAVLATLITGCAGLTPQEALQGALKYFDKGCEIRNNAKEPANDQAEDTTTGGQKNGPSDGETEAMDATGGSDGRTNTVGDSESEDSDA